MSSREIANSWIHESKRCFWLRWNFRISIIIFLSLPFEMPKIWGTIKEIKSTIRWQLVANAKWKQYNAIDKHSQLRVPCNIGYILKKGQVSNSGSLHSYGLYFTTRWSIIGILPSVEYIHAMNMKLPCSDHDHVPYMNYIYIYIYIYIYPITNAKQTSRFRRSVYTHHPFPLKKYQSLISMKRLFYVLCVVLWLPKILSRHGY